MHWRRDIRMDAGPVTIAQDGMITQGGRQIGAIGLFSLDSAAKLKRSPSVFSELPKLLERAGPGEEGQGAITGIFSVLVDGDDHNDPVADAIRGTLDGHIVLDRAIADQGRFPAVNVLTSISRLAQTAWTTEQSNLAAKLRALIARYEDTRDLRLMGGYRQGSDAELDQAVVLVPKIYDAITQSPNSGQSKDAFRELTEFLQAK
jgi:flagellum-specific ATP synthase